jgi:hypothetical protein
MATSASAIASMTFAVHDMYQEPAARPVNLEV